MDALLADDGIAPSASLGEDEPVQIISYDDTIPYEEQIQPEPSNLANRIGKGKVYLLADAAAERTSSKKKLADGSAEDVDMDEDGLLSLDPDVRPNALLFSGPPIAHLPTQRIFAYATHFEAHPLGLEWVSDTTCVLVFSSRSSAQKAYRVLQKIPDEEPSLEDGSIAAKTIPVPLWPAEKQLSRSLELAMGKSSASERKAENRKRQEQGLAGPLRMRWARNDDVKKRNARNESEFYRKHGNLAGKETVNGRDIPNLVAGAGGRKRGRDDEDDMESQRARLDEELDAFLEDKSDGESASLTGRRSASEGDTLETDTPTPPPSRMRSDYIDSDGRQPVRRSSQRRERGGDRDGRRRSGRDDRGRGRESGGGGLSLSDRIGGLASSGRDDGAWGRDSKRRRGGDRNGDRGDSRRGPPASDSRRTRNERPKKTQQELDDELDAFLNGGS